MFITFEGIEGSGKSTQIGLAADRLARDGHSVVRTREPGGTRIGEKIRSVLLSPEHGNMNPLAELLLYEACRAQLIAEIVRPELEKGSMVLCDRYVDATTAYQGFGRGLDMALIERLNRAAGQGIEPDLTILLDCSVERGFERLRSRYRHHSRGGAPEPLDRMEKEGAAFHERLRKGYLQLAATFARRIRVVDSSGDVDEVHDKVLECLLQALNEREPGNAL